MPACSYCNKEFEKTSGKLLITNTGKLLWFHSSKCEKYSEKIHRSPKRLKWTRPIKAKSSK